MQEDKVRKRNPLIFVDHSHMLEVVLKKFDQAYGNGVVVFDYINFCNE